MTGAPRTSIDPGSDTYRRNRDQMQSLLDGLREAHGDALDASRGAREWVDRVLDRDSPFLELTAPAGTVLGIGLVAGTACVIVAGGEDDDGALPPVARRNGLPVVRLDDGRDGELTLPTWEGTTCWPFPGAAHDPANLRDAVAHLAGAAPPPPAAVPSRFDDDDLLGIAPLDGTPVDVRELLHRLVDGSAFTEAGATTVDGTDTEVVTGWAHWCGFPVGVVAGGTDDGFAERCAAQGLPVLVVHGPVPVVQVRRDGEARFTLAWPRPEGDVDADAVIDPRDTRVAVGIALAVSRGR